MPKKIKIEDACEVTGRLENGVSASFPLQPGDVIEIKRFESDEFVARKLKVRILENIAAHSGRKHGLHPGDEVEVSEFCAKNWQERGLALIL